MGFIPSLLVSVIAVVALVAIALVGVWGLGLNTLFGVVIPYAAVLTFFVGFIYRVIDWGKSAVPFSIPTTCGQEKSLKWIKDNPVDCPSTTGGVLARMFFEVFLFRSLFRNTKLDYRQGWIIRYSSQKWLWLFALMFHYAFLTVILWHLKFFTEPVPGFVKTLEALDGFMQVGMPGLLLSGMVLGGAVTFLLLRRIMSPQLRYISLPSDYFPLFLILTITGVGIIMRYLVRVDVVKIKEFTMGLVTLHPTVPDGISVWFYLHLFLVCVLFAYFPFSKLMHMGGVFLSPTRNMPNDSRSVHHENPWNYPVKTHSYQEYEDDFREQMVEAGLPVEKELDETPAEKE